jgi:pimeloyl-ACP methyl ester carboxylesterase
VSAYYDDAGSGDAIVFSHGMMLDRSIFAAQIAALSGSYRAVAYDHRARRGAPGEPYDLYDLAGDFCALLDELEIERCVLAGMSMGGFMAVRAALRHRDRLAGVVLIGASAVPYPPADAGLYEQRYGAQRGAATLPSAFAAEEADGHFSARTRRDRPALVAEWRERIATRSGEATYLETLSWSRQDDVRADWAGIDLPVLVVHGDEDVAVPLGDALDTYAAAASGRLLVVPYAGHAVSLEAPDAVNDALSAFLADVYRT